MNGSEVQVFIAPYLFIFLCYMW